MVHPKAMMAAFLMIGGVFFLPDGVLAQQAVGESPPRAAVSLETRAAPHAGYGRLVLAPVKGGPSVPFTASLEGTQLRMRFNSPVSVPLDPWRRAMGAYLSGLTLSGDGQTITAQLLRDVTLKTQKLDDGTLVLDLIDQPKPGAIAALAEPPKPPLAQPTPGQTQNQPPPFLAQPIPPISVTARVTKKGADDLLTIAPARPVQATVIDADGRVQVTFDHPVQINVDRLTQSLPVDLRPASLSADHQTLAIGLPPGRRVRDSRDGNRLVLNFPPAEKPKNILEPPKPDAGKPGQPEPELPAAVPTVPVEKLPDPGELIAEKSAEAPVNAASGETKSLSSVQPENRDLGEKAAASRDKEGGTAVGETEKARPSDQVGRSADNALTIRATIIDDGLGLRFDWRDPVAAAVFRRAGAIWVVFDQPTKLDLRRFASGGWPVVTAMSQIEVNGATVVRMPTWSGFNPSILRAGNAWILEIRNQPQRPEAPVQAVSRVEGPNVAIDYPVFDPSSPYSMTDPEAGDTLVAIPLRQLGQGIDKATDYPDYRALTSIQGLVFRPNADQLSIRSLPAMVEVTAPGGLAVSPDLDRKMLRRGDTAANRLLNMADWQGPLNQPFTQRKIALLAAISSANERDRNAARLDLVKFYFASGMAPEALGVLRAVERDAPAMMQDPVIKLIRGACEAWQGHGTTALTDLNDPSLDGRPDAAIWRALVAADAGDMTGAAESYSQGKDVLRGYPPVLLTRLALRFGEATFRAGMVDDAEQLAQIALESNPSRAQKDLAMVLQGRIAGEKKDPAKALALWKEVAASPKDGLGRAQAQYALTVTGYDQGKIDRTAAIDSLEHLRFAWRGDEFEALVLRKLADLYVADTNFRQAFTTLQRIASIFPDSPLTKDVTAQMQGYFVSLFLGPQADSISPLKALGFYDEFKELTPGGVEGDAIIRKLADRLTSVELLDRAASLLDNQVKTRLSGLEQARVATQLALVRLLDRKPEDALAALDYPVTKDLPGDLKSQRSALRARALADLGRTQEALAVLTGDESQDAERVRADIYWKTEAWGPVAQLLQKNLKPPVADTIEPEVARSVLNVATAMALGKDKAGLVALTNKYGKAMEQSPFKDAFRVVADNGPVSGNTFRSLADKVAQVSDLQSFMSEYRQRIAQDGLSKTN